MLEHSIDELDDLLDKRHVVGDPIQADGATIIPLLSTGFGYGGGTGEGSATGDNAPRGRGAGAGAGGGIKPVAVVIIDQQGARVEKLEGQGGLAKIGDAVSRVMNQGMGQGGGQSQQGQQSKQGQQGQQGQHQTHSYQGQRSSQGQQSSQRGMGNQGQRGS